MKVYTNNNKNFMFLITIIIIDSTSINCGFENLSQMVTDFWILLMMNQVDLKMDLMIITAGWLGKCSVHGLIESINYSSTLVPLLPISFPVCKQSLASM